MSVSRAEETTMNLVVIAGELSSEPRTKELPSGTQLTNWEVTTSSRAGKLTVPVVWFDPPRSAASFGAGDPVAVLGAVRRRFFKTSGRTVSVTEVVGERVARLSSARALERLRAAAFERLDSGVAAAPRS